MRLRHRTSTIPTYRGNMPEDTPAKFHTSSEKIVVVVLGMVLSILMVRLLGCLLIGTLSLARGGYRYNSIRWVYFL